MRFSESEGGREPDLRQRAESVLRVTRSEIASMAPEDIQKTLHELQVSQLELEMQNEELRRTQLELAESRDRLNDLFEFAPVGYLTLNEDGSILEANLTATRLFGITRSELLKRKFADLVGRDSQDVLHRHRQEMMASGGLHTCELDLVRSDGSKVVVQLECNQILSPDGTPRHCRAILMDITRRRIVEEKLKQSIRQLHGMTQRLVESQESERHRISRELHDQIGNSLTAVQLHLQRAEGLPDGETLKVQLRESLRVVSELAEQTQDMSLSLRPSLLDDLGLIPAFRWLLDRQGARAGLRTELRAAALKRRMDPAVEIACFRVAQEALTNVIRHAKASRVVIELLTAGSALLLTVTDDGCGFDPVTVGGGVSCSGRLGLIGMEERVSLVEGKLEIHSASKGGTAVHARFPLRWREPDAPSAEH